GLVYIPRGVRVAIAAGTGAGASHLGALLVAQELRAGGTALVLAPSGDVAVYCPMGRPGLDLVSGREGCADLLSVLADRADDGAALPGLVVVDPWSVMAVVPAALERLEVPAARLPATTTLVVAAVGRVVVPEPVRILAARLTPGQAAMLTGERGAAAPEGRGAWWYLPHSGAAPVPLGVPYAGPAELAQMSAPVDVSGRGAVL